MSYARKDTGGGCLGRNSHSQSEATPQPYSPEQEQEHANMPHPPHCVSVVAPPVHCSSYATQWNAPTLHSSAQDQRYGMPAPYVNDMMARGHSGWIDAQQSTPFNPQAAMAMDTVIPYKDQSQNQVTGNAPNVPTANHQDNRFPTGRTLPGWSTMTTGFQPGGVVDYGPTLGGPSAHSVTGNDVQAFAPDGEVPVPSETLKTLTRRYILDPKTRIEAVHMGPNRFGRLKITITLEAADGV